MEKFQRQKVAVSKLPPQVVEKWSPSVLAEGFTPFPKKLLRCLNLIFPNLEPMEELAALLAVVDFKRPNLTRPPSREFLAFLAGLEGPVLEAALARLEAKSLIKIKGDPAGLEITLNGLLERIDTETKE